MSFDLAIWSQQEPMTPERAYEIYDQLTDGIQGVSPAAPAIGHFYNALMSECPDDDGEDSPWAAETYNSDECVLLSISWSMKDEISEIVMRLADEKGLIVYDPQARAVRTL